MTSQFHRRSSHEKLLQHSRDSFELPPSAPFVLAHAESDSVSTANDEHLENPLHRILRGQMLLAQNFPAPIVNVYHRGSYPHCLTLKPGELLFSFTQFQSRMLDLFFSWSLAWRLQTATVS